MGRRTHHKQNLHNQRDPTPASSQQTAPVIPSSPGRPPRTEGEITMEHRRGEFTMEPRKMSPMQPRQRQKTLEYSSTISPYNMDRTARIKATSNLAAQTDSFQDHLISRYFSGTAPLYMFGSYLKFLSRPLSQISIKTGYLAMPFKTLALVYL